MDTIERQQTNIPLAKADYDSMIILLTAFYLGSLIWIPAFGLDIWYGIISSIVYLTIGLILNHKSQTKNNSNLE